MKPRLLRRLWPSRRGPMSCDEVGRWLQHHLDGELDPGRSRRLSAHLEDCKRCGLEAATYQKIKDGLAHRRAPLPEDAVARLRQFGEQLARGDAPPAP